MYRINEIFYSLQGEGIHTGMPAVFVRFAGCNLHCPFCDTDFSVREQLSAEQIVHAIARAHASTSDRQTLPMVVLTGGEPALQVDDLLLETIHQAGYYVCIETNGTQPLPKGIDWITCSPKTTSNTTNPIAITHADELKVVYTGQNVEYLFDTIEATHHLLQPCDYTDEQRKNNTISLPSIEQSTGQTVEYILAHPHWRLSLQTHKYLHIR